ncbi:hypothetical protein UlMin_023801 [Ulmus minor]
MDGGMEINDLFNMTDEQITNKIYATHVHAKKKFDEDSLFLVVENVLKHSLQIADKLAQGSNVLVDKKDEISTSDSNFIDVPFRMIKEIGCNLSCKAPDERIIYKTTLAILEKLSECTWEAKAVVTLAAFALEFGDFWHFAQATQLKTSDQLTNSLGILKGVPAFLTPSEEKRRQEVLNLNKLINTTMDIIKILDKFEKHGDRQDIPSLCSANKQIPIHVFWAIVTIIACSTKISILTSDQPDKHFDLYHYTNKVNSISKDLIEKLSYCNKELEVAMDYGRIKKLFGTSTEIMESFKALINFTEDSLLPLIIDGFTSQKVQIDVLKKKNVFTFISSLEISETEISFLKAVHEKTKKDDLYTIVWIPIVEKWTTELKKKFEATLTSYKMPWYVVPSIDLSVAGIKFIKEDWHFNGKPILVALNSTSGLENENAFHHIYSYGMEAYPFDGKKIALLDESKWIRSAVEGIHPSLVTWFEEERHIFFYGGKDNEWIEKFKRKANTFVTSVDPFLKDLKMVVVCVGSGKEGPNIQGKFWNAIEHLFMTKVNKPLNPITKEIYKLFSYKEESGWGVLCKGSSVKITGHGIAFLKVLEEFDEWEQDAYQKGFAESFKNKYHAKVNETVHRCTHIDVTIVDTGIIPKFLNCPECDGSMERVTRFECCHKRKFANGDGGVDAK